ncbi:MAG: LptA/OstA family protein [Vicinamibacterales bacterium]
MARWQKHARLGVGVFGIASAIAVYAAIGGRQAATPVERPARLDPRAILESAGAAFRQFSETKQDFVVEAERQLTYEDGSTKFIGATIKVRNREGRDFTVSGHEGQARENAEELEIVGGVTLTASDGFTVTADRATFTKADSTVRVPGAVAFHKGGMSGSGAGMTYNEATDVLALADAARVAVTGAAGRTQTEFTSRTATLARRDKYLVLEGNVHALRGEQVLEADRGVARLSEDEERITFIELRGNARVVGGGVDSMHARDIDLDYTDDGATLERVALRGSSAVVMSGQGGAAGRQFVAESLDLEFAPNSSLTGAAGRGDVRVEMPGTRETPARSMTAQAFNAFGDPGAGLTSARFNDEVEYREEAHAARPSRTARSAALQLALADDAVTGAVFTGGARFAEEGLQASGAHADYDPGRGTLRLSGADAGGGPRVANADIQIEADSINVTLDGPRMLASGTVKTVLRQRQTPPRAAGPGAAAGRDAPDDRLPSLLRQGDPVNVNANALDYQDAAGTAVYSGNAALWQGETAIRGDVLTLDRARGDFIASGAARSSIVLDTGVSVGRAAEIRFDDAERRITYATPVLPAGRGAAPLVPAQPVSTATSAQVSGPLGDLRARRIELALNRTAARLDRVEAYADVTVRLDKRVATGDRLTYHADDERYVMTGIATVPVRIMEECRETSGRTVTFFRSADRVIVDGNEEVRTQSSRSGPCPQPTTR